MVPESNAADDEAGSRGEAGAYGDYLAEREEILRHKWFISEKAGRDTGFESALIDWAHHFHGGWRRQRAKRND